MKKALLIGIVAVSTLAMISPSVLADVKLVSMSFTMEEPENTTYYTSDIHLVNSVIWAVYESCSDSICMYLYGYRGSEYIKYSVDDNPNVTVCTNCQSVDEYLTLPHGVHTITLYGYTSYDDYGEFSKSVTFTVHLDSDNDGIIDSEDKCPDTVDEQLVYGCSCHQILDLKPGENTGEYRTGCSLGTIEVFTKAIGWAKELFG